MVLGEKIVDIMQKVMAENKSKPFPEVLEILEIKLRETNVPEEQIKMIKDGYTRGFFGTVASKKEPASINNENDNLNIFGEIMTNPHHNELVEQEKRDDVIRRVEYFESPLEEARKKSTKKGSSNKKKMLIKLTALVLSIITAISTIGIIIKVNEEKLFRLIQTAVIEHRLEKIADEISNQTYPFILDDHEFTPTMDQEKLVNGYNEATENGVQLVPGIPNEVAVVAGTELLGDNKGLYGDKLANQASLALTGKTSTDVYSTYVNGYQYQYGPIKAKDVVEYTVDQMWKEIEEKRVTNQNPEQNEGDDFSDKRGIYRA